MANFCFFVEIRQTFEYTYLMNFCIPSSIAVVLTLCSAFTLNARNVELLDKNWKFENSDPKGAESLNFDDSKWETVSVPHDWAIDKNFDISIDAQEVRVSADGEKTYRTRTGRSGALPFVGTGWYRKNIDIPKSSEGKRIFAEFDGAMSNAKIWLNGKYLGERPYGYSSFSIDLTPAVNFGENNLLAVRLENKPLSSRWYPGAGIYRNVRIVEKSPIHIDYCGVFIKTPQADQNLGVCDIEYTVKNFSKDSNAKLETQIIDENSNVVASASSDFKAKEGESKVSQKIELKNPKLWNTDSPNLYTAKTKIFVDGQEVDSCSTKFGFRTIAFDKYNGFSINGKRVKIKGVCMHHDLGPIGAAVNYRAIQRQVEIMKDMGCNAIRTSHNPPAPELLDICDEIGMFVMDEAFDEWKDAKCDNGYNKLWEKWAEKDLIDFIKRDRNHPSVIIWSVGNEVEEQKNSENGAKIARFLVDIAHRTDPTRPVTSGMNFSKESFRNGLMKEFDLVGLNYKPHQYDKFSKSLADKPFFGSETDSTVASRGKYFLPASVNNKPWRKELHVSSYNTEFPPWTSVIEKEWIVQDDNPRLLGEFAWSGFDYLGEPYPYDSESIAKSSYFGCVDLAGLPKDKFYLYRSRWNDKEPTLHLLPHWNWNDGQKIPVHCYTSYDKAELFVNGKSLGTRQKNPKGLMDRYRLMWEDVPYEPGELKVVAFDKDGKPAAETSIKTAGEPHAIRMTPDRKVITPSGKDLCFVTIEVLDKDGNPCPTADTPIFVRVSGNGKLKALCNGDPTDYTPFSASCMRLFSGKLVAVIESDSGNRGEIRVDASSAKIKPASIAIDVKN